LLSVLLFVLIVLRSTRLGVVILQHSRCQAFLY
jgi:hypothetical protein